jgi:hypothetical protein
MKDLKISKKFVYLYFLLTITLLPLWFGSQIFVLLFFWYGLGLLALYTAIEKVTDNYFRGGLLLLILGYPILEIIIKIFMFYDLIPYSYEALNIIEHGLFSLSITIVVKEVFQNTAIVKNNALKYLMVFCVITTLGFGNELLEFFIRQWQGLYHEVYYFDTMKDMIVNMLAGAGVLAFDAIWNLRSLIFPSYFNHSE